MEKRFFQSATTCGFGYAPARLIVSSLFIRAVCQGPKCVRGADGLGGKSGRRLREADVEEGDLLVFVSGDEVDLLHFLPGSFASSDIDSEAHLRFSRRFEPKRYPGLVGCG